MNKTIVGGLTAILITSGAGLTAGAAQASPSPTTSRAVAQAVPLDLCGLLPDLCTPSVLGPLLTGVDTALDDLLGATPDNLPQTVNDLVAAIIETLTAGTADQQAEVTGAVAALLANAGLDPAVLDQVTSGLSGSAVGDPVSNVLETTTALVSGLLGLGGQTVDPAILQDLVQRILAAQAANDTAALSALLSELLRSLPGGSGLDAGTVTTLVDDITNTLADAATGVDVTPTVDRVDNALNPPSAAAASSTPTISRIATWVTSTRPTIRGAGTPGASVAVRTSKGTVLGTTTVSSSGSFSLVSRKLKRGAYTVTATQVAPGMSASGSSAARNFRVVSSKPAITTKAKKRFSTHRPKISGIGYPKSKIVLRSSTGKKLGTVRVRTNGTWTIKSKTLSSGTKKLKAVQTGHGKKKTSKAKKIRIR